MYSADFIQSVAARRSTLIGGVQQSSEYVEMYYIVIK